MSRAPWMRVRRPRTTLSALAAVLLFAAVGILPAGAAAPGGSAVPAATATTTWINLTVTDALAFAPTAPSSPTLSVTFQIRNAGTTDHTFTVSSRVNLTAPTGSDPTNVSGNWFDGAHVLLDVSVPAGQTVTATATFPTAGTYQFICRFHYPSMQGSVTVGMGQPSTSSPPSYLLYGATGAIVLIVVVIATVWFLGRRKSRAPASPPAATPPQQ